MPEYWSWAGILCSGSDGANVDNLRIDNQEEIAASEQRWMDGYLWDSLGQLD